MNKYKIILNPASGRGMGERSLPIIEKNMRDYGLDFDLVQTERPWHAKDLALQAAFDGYSVVVAAGGDGTVNEVLNGLMLAKKEGKSEVALGCLGVGRGNDFGFGMGIPQGVESGCKVLHEDCRKTIDVGKVTGGLFPEGRYFGNGVGIGFDAVVGFEALKMKRLHGFLSYLVAALKTIFLYYNPPIIRIEYESNDVTQQSLMVSVMNGRRMGGGFMMAPNAETDDGLLDLCIAGSVSRMGIFALMPRFMNGTQHNHKAITTGRAKKVKVTAVEGVLPAHADGETLCKDGHQLTIELIPSAVDIIYLLPGAV
jgi:YegS/Rv2252/BmrU family lipid kinase